MLYVYHHLGLGDHIVCNGILREFCKIFGEISLFCKEDYYESIKFMYRNLKNLIVIPVKDSDNGVFRYLNENNINWNDVIKIGGYGNRWGLDKTITFDKNFYLQAGIPFEKRWNSFYFERDIEREDRVFNLLNISFPYIVIHEDKERGFVINRKYLKNDNIVIINNSLTNNIFDYTKVFQKASEIHIVESCFLFLVDSIEIETKQIYAHRYARQYDWISKPNLKKEWIIL
jgi:predicted nucleic-acid-binding protein